MDRETLFDAIVAQPSQFTATVLYRDLADIDQELLDADGHRVAIAQNMSMANHDIWYAIHQCCTEQNTLALFVSPTKSAAHGVPLLVEDEIGRSLADELWGDVESTKTRVSFGNGSKIVSAHTQGQDPGKQLRGYHPDVLCVANWTENGCEISDETKEDVLLPMIHGDTTVWVADTKIDPSDKLHRAVLSEGAHVTSVGE